MTKSEYEQLLQSDYWKGFSYSLIKERNFTCEDCGKQFVNERNKLQVHHLVYRDIKPWSYKPDEMVVLCIECHQKRHGIYKPQQERDSSGMFTSGTDDYTKTYGNYKEQKHTATSTSNSEIDDFELSSSTQELFENFKNRLVIEEQQTYQSTRSNSGLKIIIIAVITLFVLFCIEELSRTKINPNDQIENTEESVFEQKENGLNRKSSFSTSEKKQGTQLSEEFSEPDDFEPVDVEPIDVVPLNEEPLSAEQIEAEPVMTHKKMEKSTLELLEEKQYKEWVERAKKAGVSTEGSTIDIMERIQHKEWVERAKKAGVSTEGSTIDIIERIQRKNSENR